MAVHPCRPASAIARVIPAGHIAAGYVTAITPSLRTSSRSLLDRMDSPQQNSGSLPELSGARRDIGGGSPRLVGLVGQVIFELHFLLGRELAVLFVVIVGRLLDGGTLRIECGTTLDDEHRHQQDKREHQP